MSIKMRFVALGVATVLVLALWFGAVYHPGSAKLGKLKQDVAASQAQEASLQAELTRLQGLQAQAPELRADNIKFAQALPADPSVSHFIRLVQDASNKAGLDFLSIAPSLPAGAAAPAPAPAPVTSPAPSSSPAAAPVAPAPQPAPMQTITIQISAKGSFFPMKDFIHRLEHLPRALKVTTFSVSGSGGPATAPLSVSITMSIFEAPAPVVAAPAVATSPAPGA